MSATGEGQNNGEYFSQLLATPSGVLDSIPTPVFIKDKHGRYLFLNESARRVLALDGRSYVGKTDKELFDIDIADLRYQSDQRALLTTEAITYQQWLMVGGQSRCFLTTKHAIRDQRGEVLAIFGCAHDLSKEDIQLDSAGAFHKPEFFANFSHELRTPLNAILGFSQLLSNQLEAGSDQQDSARLIEKAGRHLAELIDQLIDMVKLDTGNGRLKLESCQLEEMLVDCINIISPLAAQRNIEIYLDNTLQNVAIKVDRLKMRQVLLNILSNAVKYNHDNGKIFVTVNEQGKRIGIEIRDTGPGIAEDKQPLVFEPFNRLGAEATSTEGTGLGLSICKQLVERMAGKIELISELNEGCRFLLTFRAAEQSLQNTERTLEEIVVAATEHTPLGKKRVLYIEDNATNVRFLQLLLAEHQNVELLVALNGEEGIELASRYQPDLILLDMRLPDMHGLEVLEAIKATGLQDHQQIFAVTADALPDQVEEATAAGVHGYLTKPLDIAQIKSLVS